MSLIPQHCRRVELLAITCMIVISSIIVFKGTLENENAPQNQDF